MSSIGPYRAGGEAAALPPSELRLTATTLDLDYARTFKLQQLGLGIGSTVLTLLTAIAFSDATLTMCVLLVTTACLFFWRGRMKRTLRRATIEVRDGRLRVFRSGLVCDIHLSELLRIVLSEESQTHFASVGGGVREAQPGGTGRCYVLLQTANRSFSLLEHPISHMEALEWISLVRGFLRGQEWDADGAAERAASLAEAVEAEAPPSEEEDDA